MFSNYFVLYKFNQNKCYFPPGFTNNNKKSTFQININYV